SNQFGQIGGFSPELYTPHQALASSGVVDLSSGVGHSVLLDHNGDLWAVGLNNSGQLGDGTTTTRNVLARVAGLSDVLSVSSGTSHNLALRGDGTVWSWGNSQYMQLGDGLPVNRTLPLLVPGISNIEAVSAGHHHSVALLANGTVVAWGRNDLGSVGDGTFTHRGVPTPVQGLTTAVQISAGGQHNLVLLDDGTVWAWGSNWEGQLGDDTNLNRNVPIQVDGLNDVVYVAATGRSSFAITSDGSLWAWGANDEGMLGLGSGSEAIRHPTKVATITGVTKLAGTWFHTIALRNDGTVWSWGGNWQGQLGDGSLSFAPYPRQVLGVLGASRIAVGEAHSLAVADRKSAGPVPTQLTVSPKVVYGGSAVEVTVHLNRSAPQGGTNVLIATSGSNLVASESVTVQEGAMSGTTQLQVWPVAGIQERILIHASVPGTTRRTILYVNRPFLAGLALDPPVVPGGLTATGTVTLNAPAPDGGIEIMLNSKDSAASVPSRVVIAAGEASATFAIETSAIG
ncbi:MAG: hypothetical protein K8H99_10605, partial [Nitrospirae bacterium]|nr:hypothetical protein [Fimbriimonadaceae bacterium]